MNKKQKKLIIGNWKMNPTSVDEAKKIFRAIKSVAESEKNIKTVVCPPFVYIGEIAKIINNNSGKMVSLGSQDVFWQAFGGPFTGEISPTMLGDADVKYVIVGHSERRELGETNEIVAKKVLAVVKEKMTAVLCVGEKVRDKDGLYFEFLRQQIKTALSKVSKKYIDNLVLAYEPIWAIGKNETEAIKGKDLHEMVIFIRKILTDIYGAEDALNIPILYGGSVTPRNTLELVGEGQAQGLLVGRQSLEPESFAEILKIVGQI